MVKRLHRAIFYIITSLLFLFFNLPTAFAQELSKSPFDLKEDFVLIEAGTFKMGNDGSYKFESPAHQVTISKPYYLGKYEVTYGQWVALMGTNPNHIKRPDRHPIDVVSWDDVQDYLEKLNNLEECNACYRLPTEAEWEYAARAGKEFGIDMTKLNSYAWHGGNTNKIQLVGKKQPNPWGLYDMNGNVWELVQDWYGDYSPDAAIDPTGPETGKVRVTRGGSARTSAGLARSTMRSGLDPDASEEYGTGLRLVRVVQ